jgi:CheY-like chemotaxis protein
MPPPKRILVVEDSPVMRLLLTKQLGKLGFECLTVETGEEGVLKANEDFALIIIDIGLPGIDGLTATQQIRRMEAEEGRKRTPIVALTAHSSRERCLEAGLDDFVQKPALLEDLRQILTKWVG